MADNFLYQKENAFQSKSNVDEVSSNNSSENNPIAKILKEFDEAENFPLEELKKFWRDKLEIAYDQPDILDAIIAQMQKRKVFDSYLNGVYDSFEFNPNAKSCQKFDKTEHLIEEEVEKFWKDKLDLAGKDTDVLDAIVDELENMNLKSNIDSLENVINSREDEKFGNELIYRRILNLRERVKKNDMMHKTLLKCVVYLKDCFKDTASKNILTEAHCQRLISNFSRYKSKNAEFLTSLQCRLEIFSQENCDEFNEMMRINDDLEEINTRFLKYVVVLAHAFS